MVAEVSPGKEPLKTGFMWGSHECGTQRNLPSLVIPPKPPSAKWLSNRLQLKCLLGSNTSTKLNKQKWRSYTCRFFPTRTCRKVSEKRWRKILVYMSFFIETRTGEWHWDKLMWDFSLSGHGTCCNCGTKFKKKFFIKIFIHLNILYNCGKIFDVFNQHF